jgi:NTE family protein
MARIDGKTAFVFTGGGSLGAIQVGMLRVLLAAGVHPDFVVGASVGAINASYFASVPTLVAAQLGCFDIREIWWIPAAYET